MTADSAAPDGQPPSTSEHRIPEREPTQNSVRWALFETAYIESGKNLKTLAAEFGAGYSTARKYARENDWRKKRTVFQEELRQQRLAVTGLTRIETFRVQQETALETAAVFRAVFESQARDLRNDPDAKGAVATLGRLIDLQLDFEELILTVLGDLEPEANRPTLQVDD